MKIAQIIQSFVGLVKTFKLSSRPVARRITCSYLYFEMTALQKWIERGPRWMQEDDLEGFEGE